MLITFSEIFFFEVKPFRKRFLKRYQGAAGFAAVLHRKVRRFFPALAITSALPHTARGTRSLRENGSSACVPPRCEERGWGAAGGVKTTKSETRCLQGPWAPLCAVWRRRCAGGHLETAWALLTVP